VEADVLEVDDIRVEGFNLRGEDSLHRVADPREPLSVTASPLEQWP
jgi:hypothetical protein